MRILFFYLMKDESDRVRHVAPDHAAYWRNLALDGFEGGPFEDKSGGLIVFQVGTAGQAKRLVANDPFVREGLIESRWLKHWTPLLTTNHVGLSGKAEDKGNKIDGTGNLRTLGSTRNRE